LWTVAICAIAQPMQFALIAQRTTPTNEAIAGAIVDGVRWEPMTPEQALASLRPGDAALGRLDVRPTLDGVDDGMWALGALEARRVVVLNDSAALFATHDKLLTARLLRRADVPHPRTAHVQPDRPFPAVRPPVVVKPRFGSGGLGVTLCEDEEALCDALSRLSSVPWFEQQGVLVQELVPPQGYDLRILVAGQRIVGAIFRIAAEGEWRTNIALGGSRRPVADPPQQACEIALAAARAAGAALVGVDLVPDGLGGWTVIELNGAVEFTHEYQPGGDVFLDVAAGLAREAVASLEAAAA
jgi:[lysine-biosynthesis-protein LysW]---L-2-aminoadipate ligase